jgi:hypothetical protein
MRRVRLLTVAAVAAACALAGCGSQLDPDSVASVNGTTAVGGSGGTVPGGADGGSGLTADGGAAGTTGDSAGSAGSTGAGGGAAGGSTTEGTGANAAAGAGRAGSCEGFKNQTGITDTTITLANVADISGPVPGIFESAQDATRAYAAYFNATNDICGRKLDVELLDSRADAGADQQAYTKACDEAFAAVGSMGAFDSGGAGTARPPRRPSAATARPASPPRPSTPAW